MVELIIASLEGFFRNPTVMAIGAGIVLAMGAWIKGRLSGAKAERNKQAIEEVKARDIADQVDNDIGALPIEKARNELKGWRK